MDNGNKGAAHDAATELVQIRADLVPAAHEALGYAALASNCLYRNQLMLAADMFNAAASSLSPWSGNVTITPLVEGQNRMLQAIDYGALALEALNNRNVLTAAEMFRCAAQALREAT